MNVSDGMTYAPKGKPSPVVKDGDFVFSAVRLDSMLFMLFYVKRIKNHAKVI